MMRRFLSGLLVLAAVPALFTVGAASVEEEPMVGVRIVYTLDEIKATPSESYYLRVFDEETRVTLEPAQPLVIKTDGAAITATSGDKELLKGAVLDLTPGSPAGSLTIEKVPYGIGWWWAGVEDRDYEGKIQIRINENKKLDVVVTLPIEEYLRGVVPSEIGGDSPAEALKAQAVAARSETVTALRKRTYAGDHYDMCADVECQVYSGTKKRTEATDAAIKATRGLVLTYKDEPIPAFYASNCGGCSEDAWNVWPSRTGPVPYWSSRFDTAEAPTIDLKTEEGARQWVTSEPDVFCNPKSRKDLPNWSTKNFRWKVETTADQLTALVAKKKDIGRVLAIKPGTRGPSGRLISATFVGEKGELEVGPELAIRQIWEPPLRSSCFVVDVEGGTAERPEKFTMTGAGWGHGVGMCQTGAVSRAVSGQDFRTILGHYYKDSEVKEAYK
jgi:stage II sporulation protein D